MQKIFIADIFWGAPFRPQQISAPSFGHENYGSTP